MPTVLNCTLCFSIWTELLSCLISAAVDVQQGWCSRKMNCRGIAQTCTLKYTPSHKHSNFTLTTLPLSLSFAIKFRHIPILSQTQTQIYSVGCGVCTHLVASGGAIIDAHRLSKVSAYTHLSGPVHLPSPSLEVKMSDIDDRDKRGHCSSLHWAFTAIVWGQDIKRGCTYLKRCQNRLQLKRISSLETFRNFM